MQTTDMPTSPMRRPTWNPEAGYQHLAHESVLPVFTRLAEGKPDAEALLAAAFSPLVHVVLERCLDAGASGLFSFLGELAQPAAPHTVTRFVDPGTAWIVLEQHPEDQVAAAFDLRPGGGPELAQFPYVPLGNPLLHIMQSAHYLCDPIDHFEILSVASVTVLETNPIRTIACINQNNNLTKSMTLFFCRKYSKIYLEVSFEFLSAFLPQAKIAKYSIMKGSYVNVFHQIQDIACIFFGIGNFSR